MSYQRFVVMFFHAEAVRVDDSEELEVVYVDATSAVRARAWARREARTRGLPMRRVYVGPVS